MDSKTLRLFQRLPLPAPGEDPLSWIVDTTGVDATARTWPTHQCPYSYSPAGVWVRMAMGGNRRRTTAALRTLTDLVHRMRGGELHDLGGVDHEWTHGDIANLLMVQAVFDRDTPFIIVTVWPGG